MTVSKEQKLQEIAEKNAQRSGKSTSAKSSNTGEKSKASQRADAAGQTINDKVDGVAENLKESIKAQIVSKALRGAFEDLANGDFGEIGEKYFTAFEDATSNFYQTSTGELEAELDPKFLLNSSDSSMNGSIKSLTPAIEIEPQPAS